jgi:hypothetical protein
VRGKILKIHLTKKLPALKNHHEMEGEELEKLNWHWRGDEQVAEQMAQRHGGEGDLCLSEVQEDRILQRGNSMSKHSG